MEAEPAHADEPAMPAASSDDRFFIVNGRRWRKSDPSIPGNLRQELVDELMAARRAVRTTPETARPRVDDAKRALGERGYAWWEQPTPEELDVRIASTIRALVRKRVGSSICPSDVARVVGGEGDRWRILMPAVRHIAAAMAARSEVIVTQKGAEVDPEDTRGPLRIAAGAALGP
jgi:hypothetical protein